MNETLGPVDAATTVLGDKWTPRLLRYFLSESTVRFCQLQEMAGDINPRTLSARLVMLESEGIIVKKPMSSQRCEYELTAKGRDLLPILRQMNSWSEKYA